MASPVAVEPLKQVFTALDKTAAELQDVACLDNPLCVAKLILGGDGRSTTETVPVVDNLTGGKLENPLPIQDNKTVLISPDQRGAQGASHTGNTEGKLNIGGNTTVTPIPDGPNKDELIYQAEGDKPTNMSPQGAGRTGAFNEAKRQSGVPIGQSPSRRFQNMDKRGNPQPGYIYKFDIPRPGGGIRKIQIRDDASGHFFGVDDPQNRGPHFNDVKGNHYDY